MARHIGSDPSATIEEELAMAARRRKPIKPGGRRAPKERHPNVAKFLGVTVSSGAAARREMQCVVCHGGCLICTRTGESGVMCECGECEHEACETCAGEGFVRPAFLQNPVAA